VTAIRTSSTSSGHYRTDKQKKVHITLRGRGQKITSRKKAELKVKYFKYFQEHAGKGTSQPSKIPQKNQKNNQPANKEKGNTEETSVGK
jgi:hypothetical protein